MKFFIAFILIFLSFNGEKLFLLDSPKVVSVERKKITKVRRAKLYFLRNLGSTKTKKLKDQSWKLKSGS